MSLTVQASTFSPKDPDEVVVATFDFSEIATSITSPVVTATYKRGAADASPSAVLQGSAIASGLKVLQTIQGGVAGTDYVLRCQVDANDGQRFVLAATLPVRTA